MKSNPKIDQVNWYQMSPEEVFGRLETSNNGLAEKEAISRLERFGYNEIKTRRPGAFVRFISQFHSPLVYILLAAASVTGVLSLMGKEMWPDTVVIAGVVVMNAILGFIQEGKAERALEVLQNMIVSECKVLRENSEKVIPARELVPGDIVILNEGDRITADLRLFETHDAQTDEASMTGESIPVAKTSETLKQDNLMLGDQTCMAFSGTFLTRGSARGVVVTTGEATEFGKIASLVKTTQQVKTPLQKKISDFTRTLIIGISILGCLNFVLGYLFGYELIYSFLASVSLVVAAIPEMLPMIVTATLALSASAMAANRALTRRLPAAETLGCATVICSDKTGTLTKNEMTVQQVYSSGKIYSVTGSGYSPEGNIVYENRVLRYEEMSVALKETFRAGLLCNSSQLVEQNGQYRIIGDPTEGSLIVSAMKAGRIDTLKKLDEIPFSSEAMFMATLHEDIEYNVVYVKGSPEKILSMCSAQLFDDMEAPLNSQEAFRHAEDMAGRALRVLGMAYKKIPKDKSSFGYISLTDLTFLGIKGMIDPPRPEVARAVAQCELAGIKAVMITGDHGLTARAIARELGIVKSDNASVLTGEQLEVMSDEELFELVESVSVYARVAPEHKLRIARQYQKRGHVVAMTGDGVNDAPALKAADIGVAMGSGGSEVSKEAADMVLTDDNFATIVRAVEEGRHTWNNLERAILYTLPTNAGQALLVMGAVLMAPFIPLFAASLPLEPVQILWVNLLDSVFLTMPLIMEKKEHDLLSTPPREKNKKIADSLFIQRVAIIGVIIAACGFAVFYHFGKAAVDGKTVVDAALLTQAQTAAFWAVLMVHFGFVMSARSVFRSAFTFNPFSNRWLLLGIFVSIAARLLPTFIPGLAQLFRTAPFPVEWWLYIIPCLFPAFIALEIDKFCRRRFSRKK